MRHLRRTALLLPALLLFFLPASPAGAAYLRALVAEVPDGATLVVVNSNRRLTVVLKGVELPRDEREADQARRHLAALALGREVTVEYTGLRGQSIYGRAVREGMDLGLQVVRDGAARYDAARDNALTESERQLYAASERAARDERRGVWQAKEAQPTQAQLVLAGEVSVAPRGDRRSRPSLSTEEMVVRRIAGSAAGKGPKPSGAAGAAGPKQQLRWPMNEPGEEFYFDQYLGRGRTTIVYFYAEWCPACRQITPLMRKIQQRDGEVEVLPLDIRNWESDVVAANQIGFVPYYKIYDEGGNLIAEGEAGKRWMADQAGRRGWLK